MLANIISIPYGSIKSENPIQYENIVLGFQFLMVQLKAFSNFPEAFNPNDISIPYGSIKRQKLNCKT